MAPQGSRAFPEVVECRWARPLLPRSPFECVICLRGARVPGMHPHPRPHPTPTPTPGQLEFPAALVLPLPCLLGLVPCPSASDASQKQVGQGGAWFWPGRDVFTLGLWLCAWIRCGCAPGVPMTGAQQQVRVNLGRSCLECPGAGQGEGWGALQVPL